MPLTLTLFQKVQIVFWMDNLGFGFGVGVQKRFWKRHAALGVPLEFEVASPMRFFKAVEVVLVKICRMSGSSQSKKIDLRSVVLTSSCSKVDLSACRGPMMMMALPSPIFDWTVGSKIRPLVQRAGQ